ncbi:DNA-binding GntR family transcriptional regulator [Rhodopseudomonas julia]|uniref:DNA-binding GntR family transcriptional regulator n=1 Tax=Rhodopseudomonas julia TaxID=200617 RepID=A0ABU0C7T7_9BRAD|nr:GntR family transcriptional regulator [Rhodopseudomonas julia]MDQ0325986.1 DNA-binding GntR family transcriptional regulator [Rhodopseudomonas julia]
MLTRIVSDVASATPLRARLTERLREAIASGELPPGTPLRERHLCQTLGISRTSLREALRALESEGLAVSVPHKGAIVAPCGRKEAEDIYATRAVLEGLVAAQFADKASKRARVELRHIVEELADIEPPLDGPGFFEISGRFCAIIMEGAGNQLAGSALRSIYLRQRQLRAAGVGGERYIEECRSGMVEISAAIGRRDAIAAEAACHRHCASLLKIALSCLAEKSGSRHVSSENSRTLSTSDACQASLPADHSDVDEVV